MRQLLRDLYYKTKHEIKALSLTDEKAWDTSLWRLQGSQSMSGEFVDEYTALNYSAVYCAVQLIAGTVGTLPLKLIKRQDRKTIPADDESLYHVMHTKANGYMTALAFREAMMGHLLLWGNAYAEIARSNGGDVLEMWPITPNRVQVEMKDGLLFYRIRMEKGQEVILPREKVLHIPGLGFDGLQGYSVISMARKSIGLGMAMESFGSLFFGQGTHPGVVVTHPGKLTEPSYNNLKESLKDTHEGLGQAHRLMLLEEGMKIEKIAIEPENAQFLESRQFQIPEIARWFNLPPHKLKDLTKSSFSNISEEQISFVTDSILPWLIRLEQNYNMQLLTDAQLKTEKLYFKHNVEGLLRGKVQDRAEFYAKLWGLGAISINEIREKEDMNPIEGGDEYFVPLNMIPLSQAGEQAREPAQPQELEDAPELEDKKQIKLLPGGKTSKNLNIAE